MSASPTSFKAINQAQALAADLSLRLQGQGQSGANITVTLTYTSVGTNAYRAPTILVGTQGTGANTNSASIIFLPVQFDATTGIASNLFTNSVGVAQEVYAPTKILLGYETITATNPWNSEAARLQMIGDVVIQGMSTTLVLTASGTAPTPANVLAATQLTPAFVADQYNPLTNQS